MQRVRRYGELAVRDRLYWDWACHWCLRPSVVSRKRWKFAEAVEGPKVLAEGGTRRHGEAMPAATATRAELLDVDGSILWTRARGERGLIQQLLEEELLEAAWLVPHQRVGWWPLNGDRDRGRI